MAIPFNGFKVVFTQGFGEQEKQIEVEQFFIDEKVFYQKRDDCYIEVKENLGLTVTFQSASEDAQFFMDGLEIVPERKLAYDSVKGEVYLLPSEQPVTLFDHSNDYYPLIPGHYRIMIVYQAQQYYAWIKVLPKQLKEAQWETLKNEVEQELNGLARGLLLKKTGLHTRIQGISQGLLEQFFVINNRFSSVMTALSDLYRKANSKINKEYALVPKQKARLIDEKTVRHALSNPKNEHTSMIPIRALTYDLPENRLSKKIIESSSKTLMGFIEEVEIIQKRIMDPQNTPVHLDRMEEQTLAELEKLIEVAQKIRGAIQWIKTAPWYESVGIYKDSGIPYVMNSDSRYRALYQLYRELNNEQQQLQIHTSYSYQWKRSDKLYEIWGYIQFIKALSGEKLAFIPESGWIYNHGFHENNLLIPALPSNTEVVFRKNNLRLHLVYEARLPTQSRITTSKNPLYTRGTHTCPDGRLDVYMHEIYIGSIIFDFKYRPRNAIWNENLIYHGQQNEVMRQLISYGDNIYSNYLFGIDINPFVSRLSPIQEVWAIYPNRFGLSRSNDYPDHKVSLIELTPGQENGHFVEKIKKSIDSLIKTSEYFRNILAKNSSSAIQKA